MVKRYKARPVEIEAIKWDGSIAGADEIELWSGGKTACRGEISDKEGYQHFIFIETLEGTMKASEGDYIVKGTAGEFYPVKPDIFEKKYEEVKGSA